MGVFRGECPRAEEVIACRYTSDYVQCAQRRRAHDMLIFGAMLRRWGDGEMEAFAPLMLFSQCLSSHETPPVGSLLCNLCLPS